MHYALHGNAANSRELVLAFRLIVPTALLAGGGEMNSGVRPAQERRNRIAVGQVKRDI